jgi:hypothetical protein
MTDYAHFHGNRLNLVIHALMVPVFVVSTLALVGNLMAGRWLGAMALAGGPSSRSPSSASAMGKKSIRLSPSRAPGTSWSASSRSSSSGSPSLC